MNDALQPCPSPREWLQQSIDAYQFSQCLYVAAKLGIADLLKSGSKHCGELAQAAGADPGALFRLMRVLTCAGVFQNPQDGRFALNDVSKLLCEDAAGSLRAWAILAGEQPYLAWGHLAHSVRTGGIASDYLYGMSNWQYRSENPAAAQVFNNAMRAMARAGTAAIVDAYDFSGLACIVDVGGGTGSLLAGILGANPSSHGILLDLESAIKAAPEVFAKARVEDRCKLVTGTFLEVVPAGGDIYILKDVILMWSDADATLILRNCRKVMKTGQRLLIIEMVINSDQPTLDSAMADMRMMVMNGGHLRSQEQFGDLLTGAGFALTRILKTSSPYQILEAEFA